MLNKINQAREAGRSRQTYSRNLNAQSKLTVFTVHRMLQKIGDAEANKDITSHIFGKNVPNSSANKDKSQKSISITKRQWMDDKNSKLKFGFLLRQSETRMQCQKKFNKEIDTNHNSKNYRTKYCKTIQSTKCSDFNKHLVDKIKKVIKKNSPEQTQSQQKLNFLNFGLNIKQIKNLNVPHKLMKKKQRISMKMHKNAIHSQLYHDNLSESINEDIIRSSKQFNPCALCKSFTTKKYESQQLIEKTNLKQQDLVIKQIDCPIQLKKQKGKNKIQEISSFHKKINKMFNCLDIFLNSFHAKLTNKQQDLFSRTLIASSSNSNNKNRTQKPFNKNDKQKYTYFLGGGNNSNLIRSIFRKRSWWSQVTNLNNANFVWTQLKSQIILEKMQEYKDDNNNGNIVLYQQLDQQQQQNFILLNNSCKKSNSTSNSQGFIAKQSSFNLIFHSKQNKRYYSILDQKQAEIRLQTITTPQLLHNHYSCNYMFGNKNALYYNISHYYQFVGKNLKNIVPLTFYLQKHNRKSIIEFEKVYNESKRKDVIWIMKPAENSNRGQGIEVTTSLSHIKSKLNIQNKLIVQFYIKNLLLYNSRKFDIRTYMIGLTFNGRTKFYWYEEGYIRTASEIYDLQNLADSFIHLTNDAVQNKGENYGRYEQGNKLSYHEFQRYLDTKLQRQTWQMTQLHQQMKLLAKDAVKAIQCRINPNKKAYSFELFGLDFIIDNQFKPYLIQINTNPCLELCSPVLQRLIPRMMQNIFRICVDPIFRPKFDYFYSKSQSYYIYDETFLDRNRFALIFDDKYDRDFQWQQRCKMMRGIEWSITEQDEYADQGNIITVDY